ncbi:MAG: HIT domain-containing protein [Pseudomonadales bacterium]
MFTLHHQLAKDCFLAGELPLSSLLLLNDSNYPWFILVPRINNIREAFELSDDQQALLSKESNGLSKAMSEVFDSDKMNVAALGNQVSQLHVHHVARFKHDASWPNPVWGAVPAKSYDTLDAQKVIEQLRQKFTF